MKVLWYSNTPCNGIQYFNNIVNSTGGWLQTLNKTLEKEVQLFIVFKHSENIDFKFNNTEYIGIEFKESLQEKLKRKLTGSIQKDKSISKKLNFIENKIKPDIIHIHGTENHFLEYLHINPKNTLISIQGNATSYLQHFNSGFEGKYLNLSESIINPFSFKFRDILFKLKHLSRVEEIQLPNINYFIGRTNWDKNLSFYFNQNSIYFQGGEILREEFYSFDWINDFKDGDILKLCTTLSNNYYKGLDGVYETSILLNKKNIRHEWNIIGVNSNDLINRICVKAFRKEKHSIVFSGKKSAVEICELLSTSHLYISTSYIENSPNNICEAQLIGIPVISANVGGIGSLITNGIDGFLYPSKDYIFLTSLIIRLISKWQKAKEIGSKGKKTANLRHEINSIRNQYLFAYETVRQKNKI